MFTKNKVQISTYMVLLIPFIFLGIFASGLFSFPDLSLVNIGDKVVYLLYHIWEYKRFFNEKTMMCIGWAVIAWVFLCSYIMYHFRDFHSDIQNGSEEWADPYEVTKRRANPDDSKNRILSRHVKVDTQGDSKPSNNNMLVIGSAGTYKTTSVVTSNILKASNNIIALDVKGELMFKYGLYLKEKGYTVRCLNLKNPEMSDRYNPFAYIETEEDLIKLIANIQQSLTPPDAMKGDPFWDDGVALYLQAVFYYEWWYARKEGRKGTFNNVLKLVNDESKKADVKVEKGKQPPTILQLKMDKLAKEDSEDNPAVRDYRKLKEGASETVRSIIIITNAKLKLCETAALKRIFEDDDLNIREFATEPEYLDRASRSGAGPRGGVQRELLRGAGRLRTDVGTGRRRPGREGRPYWRTRCRAPAATHLCAGLYLRRFLPAGQGAAGERGLQTEKQTAAVGHRPYGGAAAVRRA